MDLDLNKTQNIHARKLNARRIVQNDIRKPNLTSAKHVAASGVYDLNADPLVVIGMMEGTTNSRPVGIVFCHTVAVINEKAQRVAAEIAIHKHIVSAVVDATVPIMGTMHIGKLMEFTEMRNINSHATPRDMTV